MILLIMKTPRGLTKQQLISPAVTLWLTLSGVLATHSRTTSARRCVTASPRSKTAAGPFYSLQARERGRF
ncbi:hypothetical protein CK221_25040 [Mesorhizobium sp. WSM3868]|nr:hypothetical protein CK221_25040 [Mesorhizobium sp. WSM3868]